MSHLRYFTCILSIIVSLSFRAIASDKNYTISVSSGLGIGIPRGNFSDSHEGAAKQGLSISIRTTVNTGQYFAFFAGYDYYTFGANVNPKFDTSWYINSLIIGGQVSKIISPKQIIRPFIEVGCGVYRPTANTKGNTINLSVSGNYNFGYNFGVGLNVDITKKLSSYISGEYNYFSDDKFYETTFSFITFDIGLHFKIQ